MPKKANTDLSPAQKTASDARIKYDAAKDAHDKAQNEKTKAALTSAHDHLQTALTAERRDRFVRVGTPRVRKAASALKMLGNLAAPRSYLYTNDDIEKIKSKLNKAYADSISKLDAALKAPDASPQKVNDDFAF